MSYPTPPGGFPTGSEGGWSPKDGSPPSSPYDDTRVPVPEPAPVPSYLQPGAPVGGYGPVGAPDAGTVLVIGILSLFPLLWLLGPVAVFIGSRSRSTIRSAPPGTYTNKGLVTIGWLLGLISSAFLGLLMLLLTVAVLSD